MFAADCYFHNFTKRPERENMAHYFPYDVKLRLLAHSRSFLANQKARNAKVGAENLLICNGLSWQALQIFRANKVCRLNIIRYEN